MTIACAICTVRQRVDARKCSEHEHLAAACILAITLALKFYRLMSPRFDLELNPANDLRYLYLFVSLLLQTV